MGSVGGVVGQGDDLACRGAGGGQQGAGVDAFGPVFGRAGGLAQEVQDVRRVGANQQGLLLRFPEQRERVDRIASSGHGGQAAVKALV
jgi:hypothetical protein